MGWLPCNGLFMLKISYFPKNLVWGLGTLPIILVMRHVIQPDCCIIILFYYCFSPNESWVVDGPWNIGVVLCTYFFSLILYCAAFIFLYFECHCFQSYKQVKRIYVPLPDPNVRRLLLKNQLKGQAFKLSSKCSKVSLDSYSLHL
jgi:hypothetical protein